MTQNFGAQPLPAPGYGELTSAIPPSAHSLRDNALPMALGVVTLIGWVGALFLSTTSSLSITAVSTAQGTALLAPALLIPLIAVAANRDNWRAGGRGLRHPTVSLLLVLLLIVAGVTPAFFLVAPLPPTNPYLILYILPFALPGFSLGVALGFAWGGLPRPMGATVGLLGGMGFCIPPVVLLVLTVIASNVTPRAYCVGSLCNPILDNTTAYIMMYVLAASDLFAIGLSLIGGLLGASLRRRTRADYPMTQAGGFPHWFGDVGLPLALGLLCMGGWFIAYALASNTVLRPVSPSWVALRAEQGALVSLPLLILIVGVARARTFWRESGRGLWGGPVRVGWRCS